MTRTTVNARTNDNIWLNGIMGLVVGDALGVPVQFMGREEIANRPCGTVIGMEGGGIYQMPPGTWSDDSSMALATLCSIINQKGIDPKDIMQQFVKWEFDGIYTPFGEAFDEGNTCSNAIYHFRETGDFTTCGRTDEYANGNGALMRILPVCLYCYERQTKTGTSDETEIHTIHEISGLTHHHLRSQLCCGIYFYMAKNILQAKEQPLQRLLQKGIDQGRDYYKNLADGTTELQNLNRLFCLDNFKTVPQDQIQATGYVVDTLESAVWCLLTTNSFQECLLKAVNLGDDTDTVAAIAGGLAGLYYTYDAIPQKWISAIQKRDWIEELCAEANR